MLIIYCLIALISSGLLTYFLRNYAINNLMDIPNDRSSHQIPTPRGGGVAFVTVFLLLLPILAWQGIISLYMGFALMGAGLLIAVVGFLDDRNHIPARWRLLAHFIAAIWILYWLAGFPSFPLAGVFIPAFICTVLAVFYLVWMLNLYNFMDGIDGLASVEAICVCVGISLLYYLQGYPSISYLPLLLACSVAGFLFWNFPPARIFMGDAGSGFLGIILGALSIQGAWLLPDFFWAWLILLGVFMVDSSWTLIRRVLRKEPLYEAHRRHGYQFAARRYGNHLLVTMAVLVINIFWLMPIALLVAVDKLSGLLGFSIAYLPLCILAYKFKSGAAQE